jgi:hypothetical protein
MILPTQVLMWRAIKTQWVSDRQPNPLQKPAPRGRLFCTHELLLPDQVTKVRV